MPLANTQTLSSGRGLGLGREMLSSILEVWDRMDNGSQSFHV